MNMAELTAQAREYLGIMLYINVYYTVGAGNQYYGDQRRFSFGRRLAVWFYLRYHKYVDIRGAFGIFVCFCP